jgi:hypothetical protein
MPKALMIEAARVGGLFECPSMGAYVKIKFILIRIMAGELRSYHMTIGPSDNDFFMNHGSTIIVESELNIKDITNIYWNRLGKDKTQSTYG